MAEAGASRASASVPAQVDDPLATPDRRFLALVAIAGALAFGLACWIVDGLARLGVYGSREDSLFVTPFWRDAVGVLHGAMPYRDFLLEYPPLSLPVFVLPALPPLGDQGRDGYTTGFEVLMAVIGMALVPIVVATIARLGGRRSEVVLGAGVVAASPLLLGSTAITRYDLWPALLAAAAVAAMLWDRHRVGFALLALAALAKVYPVLLGPIFMAWTWRRAGRGEALRAFLIGVATGLAGLLPFVAVAGQAALTPLERAIDRPLQIESLGASILIALHDLVGLPLAPTTFEFDSYNLDGAVPGTLATIQTIVLIGLVIAVWLSVIRRPMDGGRFVLACAAVICIDVAFGKVLSPQYVLWLVPVLAVLVPVSGSLPVIGLVVVVLLTQAYYPGSYAAFVGWFELSATLTVLARNVVLVLLAVSAAGAAAGFDGLRWWSPGPRRPPRPDRPGGPAPAGA